MYFHLLNLSCLCVFVILFKMRTISQHNSESTPSATASVPGQVVRGVVHTAYLASLLIFLSSPPIFLFSFSASISSRPLFLSLSPSPFFTYFFSFLFLFLLLYFFYRKCHVLLLCLLPPRKRSIICLSSFRPLLCLSMSRATFSSSFMMGN